MIAPNKLNAFLVLSFLLFGALLCTPQNYFVKYFGAINPVILFIILFFTGIICLKYLGTFGFSILGDRTGKGLRVGLLSAVVFFTVVLLADTRWGFPRDINVPFPFSLSFYPAIGYMVEILLHLLPISIILFFLSQTNLAGSNKDRQVMITFLVVIFLEACYQSYSSYLDDPEKLVLVVFVFFHLIAFTFVELWLFKKYDLICMYVFRLFYYIFWHIIWGYYRLDLLF